MMEDGLQSEARKPSNPSSSSPGSDGLGIKSVILALSAGLGTAALLAGLGSLIFAGSLAVLMLLVEAGLLVGVILYLAATRRRVSVTLRLGRVPARVYVLALKLGLALLLANVAATAVLGPPVYDFELSLDSQSLWERLLFVASVALVAPVVEESLFRGLLQGTLETRLRPWLAIVIAAVPFALLHGPQPAIFFVFWSLPVGWFAWRTGSVRPGIVVHAMNNLVGVVGLFAAGEVDPDSIERGAEVGWVAPALLLIAALWSVRICQRVGDLTGLRGRNKNR